ncbi:MAG TPA: carboxymuconolactone decarboxylase family protein [Methanomassiliicoccales archaeon]|jgi:AhpD family alkylhydroperoxidase
MAEGNPEGDRYSEERVQRVLDRVRKVYGQIPVVSEVLSSRPDMFIPYSELSSAILFKPKFMDQKTMELASIAAGSALGAEHCLMVHFKQASKYGASEDEMFDAVMVGAMMAMTSSQAVAYRVLAEFRDSTRQ